MTAPVVAVSPRKARRNKAIVAVVLIVLAVGGIIQGCLSRTYEQEEGQAVREEGAVVASPPAEPDPIPIPSGGARDFLRGRDYVGDTTPRFAFNPAAPKQFMQALVVDAINGVRAEPTLWQWLTLDDHATKYGGWRRVTVTAGSGIDIVGVRITSSTVELVADPSTGNLSPKR